MTHLVGLALVAALAAAACAAPDDAAPDGSTAATAAPPSHALLFAYEDFGPSALSHTLVGDEWYTWATPGCFDIDDRFEVQVVVYQGDRAAVARDHPTVPGRADVRLVSRADAVAFLDQNIGWLAGEGDLTPLEDSVRLRLESTRARIAASFP